MNVLVYAAGGEVSYWANQAKETHPLQYYSFGTQGLGYLWTALDPLARPP